jgi:hypothetical protein
MKSIQEIKSFPTVRDKVHESCYKSYQLLELVKEMLIRKDSHETILMVIEEIENVEKETK